MSQDPRNNRNLQLEIKLDEDIAQGAYANMAVVNHTGGEFILDFIFVQPQQPKARVRSRVITSPKGAKTLLAALGAAVNNYEREHGTIVVEPLSTAPHEPEMH